MNLGAPNPSYINWKHTILKSAYSSNNFICKCCYHSITSSPYGVVEHYTISYVSLDIVITRICFQVICLGATSVNGRHRIASAKHNVTSLIYFVTSYYYSIQHAIYIGPYVSFDIDDNLFK